MMAVVYVTQPGAEVRKRGGRLHVVHEDETLMAIPLRDIDRVVLFGPAQLSAAATRALLQASVPVVYGSMKGRYYGMLSAAQTNAERLLVQVDRHRDDSYRLTAARNVIGVKIRHQRSLLRRVARNHPDTALTEAADGLSALLPRLDRAASISELMGFEGHASALYFGVFGRCLRGEGITFTHRNRRPPRDPVNALLSLGYMMLTGEATGAVMTVGLHVGIGFLHEVAYNRPSLALDVVEFFRQPLVDRLTLSLFNRRVFIQEHFQEDKNGGVRLQEDAFKRYMHFYERAMETSFQLQGETVSFRQLLRNAAEELRRAIVEGTPWQPEALSL